MRDVTPSIVRSLFVTAARPMKLPTSMCSGAIAHSPPFSFSTPWIRRTFDSMPSICGAERDEEAAEILHVRLAGGVADRRLARCEDGRHHRVLGRHHARLVEEDLGAAQAVGRHLEAALDLDLARRAAASAWMCGSSRRRPITSPPGGGTLARPSRASSGPASRNDARIRSARTASTSCDESPRGSTRTSFGPVHSALAPVAHEQLEHRLDVADARDVRERDRLVGEQARGEDRQRAVLVPGSANAAVERVSALDDEGVRRCRDGHAGLG